MIKRIVSLALVLILAVGMFAIGTIGTSAALDRTKTINFDASSIGWSSVSFYIYPQEDPDAAPIGWGSKKLVGENTGDNIWAADLSKYNLQDNVQYVVIFVNSDSGVQTCNLLFDTSCIGDLAYCTGKEIENDVDSNKKNQEVKWKSSTVYGPEKKITSIGNIIGDTVPAAKSPYGMFVSFLKDTLSNARQYANKDDQTLIDDTAKALGIGKNDTETAISEAGASADWSKDKSTLDADSASGAKDNGPAVGQGSAYYKNESGDNGSSSGSGSGSSSKSGSSSGSGSGSGGGSSSKSGSASNTQTGQEENILFIMLGVMVLAAGVIFFVRKKERA